MSDRVISVRLVCTGNRTHKNTLVATCTLHDDWMETTRLHTRHSDEWGKTNLRCKRCPREWSFKDDRLEASVLEAARLGESRVDLSRVA